MKNIRKLINEEIDITTFLQEEEQFKPRWYSQCIIEVINPFLIQPLDIEKDQDIQKGFYIAFQIGLHVKKGCVNEDNPFMNHITDILNSIGRNSAGGDSVKVTEGVIKFLNLMMQYLTVTGVVKQDHSFITNYQSSGSEDILVLLVPGFVAFIEVTKRNFDGLKQLPEIKELAKKLNIEFKQ